MKEIKVNIKNKLFTGNIHVTLDTDLEHVSASIRLQEINVVIATIDYLPHGRRHRSIHYLLLLFKPELFVNHVNVMGWSMGQIFFQIVVPYPHVRYVTVGP